MPHMEPGSIVEFFEERRILCGVVLELKGERLRVLAQSSREFTLPPKRHLHKEGNHQYLLLMRS